MYSLPILNLPLISCSWHQRWFFKLKIGEFARIKLILQSKNLAHLIKIWYFSIFAHQFSARKLIKGFSWKESLCINIKKLNFGAIFYIISLLVKFKFVLVHFSFKLTEVLINLFHSIWFVKLQIKHFSQLIMASIFRLGQHQQMELCEKSFNR